MERIDLENEDKGWQLIQIDNYELIKDRQRFMVSNLRHLGPSHTSDYMIISDWNNLGISLDIYFFD